MVGALGEGGEGGPFEALRPHQGLLGRLATLCPFSFTTAVWRLPARAPKAPSEIGRRVSQARGNRLDLEVEISLSSFCPNLEPGDPREGSGVGALLGVRRAAAI